MQDKINIHNYEAFLLDYMEGNLGAEDILLLQKFAASHAELNIDLDNIELAYVSDESFSLGSKEYLKKTSTDLVPDELFIGYIENILSDEEKKHVALSCEKNPALAKELELYQKTILASEASIVFKNKQGLKKQTRVIEFYPFAFRAAAAILLITVLSIVLYTISGSDDSGQKFTALSKSFEEQGSNAVSSDNSSSVPSQPKIDSENAAILNSKSSTVQKQKNETTLDHKETSLANNTTQNNIPTKNEDQIPVIKKDEFNPTPVDTMSKNALATNQPIRKNSFVVLEEAYDDEDIDQKKEKKGFWAVAKRALSSLNKLGVKKVNGIETVSPSTESTVLSLGNFQIQKNNFNAE